MCDLAIQRAVRLAWLLTANATVVGLFGVFAVVSPGPPYDLFGGTSDIGSRFLVQLFGATLLGEALVRGGMRGIPPGELRTALLGASFVEYVVGLAAAVLARIGGVTNEAGFVIVGLYALFAIGYGYFRFASPSSAAA